MKNNDRYEKLLFWELEENVNQFDETMKYNDYNLFNLKNELILTLLQNKPEGKYTCYGVGSRHIDYAADGTYAEVIKSANEYYTKLGFTILEKEQADKLKLLL